MKIRKISTRKKDDFEDLVSALIEQGMDVYLYDGQTRVNAYLDKTDRGHALELRIDGTWSLE